MARSWLIIPLLPLWYLLAKPYLDLHSQFPEAVRSIRDAAHFSLGLDELFTRYHSLIFFALFLFSLIFLIRRSLPKANDQKSNIIVLIAILISSFLMSLGPVLKIFGQTVKIFGLPIPLPYTLFYYLVPGFNGFRTPSRWLLLAALAAMIISSFSFRKLKSLNQKLVLLVVFLLVVLEGRPFHTSYSIDYEPPAVYRQVKDLPKDAVIIELPIKLWSSTDNQIESLRALYSLYHQHRRFNGYSGFNTLAWQSLVSSILADGLDKNNTDRLKKLGVTHIVSENKLFAL